MCVRIGILVKFQFRQVSQQSFAARWMTAFLDYYTISLSVFAELHCIARLASIQLVWHIEQRATPQFSPSFLNSDILKSMFAIKMDFMSKIVCQTMCCTIIQIPAHNGYFDHFYCLQFSKVFILLLYIRKIVYYKDT